MVTPSCVQPFSIWRSWLVTLFLWEYKTDCLQHPRPSFSNGNALVCATLLYLAKLVGNAFSLGLVGNAFSLGLVGNAFSLGLVGNAFSLGV
ncbi:hypothetical protein RIR_jg7730.t1 [Rhizophagus irregularis DAOM 181602=DAOM 197198]|nr:hypothetical protein RIR_jg7730.t1 [Rhizophagus irregularis DAOM 181602=DAOM 197198]